MRHFVYETDYFNITSVVINGASPELEKQARESLTGMLALDGNNLVRQDVAFIQSELGKIPRALRVSTRKVYPGTIRVDFVERQPLMVVNLDETYLIDKHGVLLSRIHGLDATRKGLPMLTGVQAGAPKAGDTLAPAQVGAVLAAVDFIQANDQALWKQIIEWNINSKAEVTAILRAGAEVRFGTKPPLELMDKLSGAFQTAKLRAEFEQATYIDLRMDNQLVIMPKQL
ncbi:cell division protein FtsQ/DivIB [bacterium]|nr:cell division protein FtsQ/DivIB [bacterium]